MNKMINLIFIVFPFLAAVIAVVWIVETFDFLLTGFEPSKLLFLLILPLVIVIGGFFTVWQSFKALRKNSSLFSRKRMVLSIEYGVIFLCSLITIIITGFIVGSLFNYQPPQFFPFDDNTATYTVTFKNNWYYIVYDSPSNKNSFFNCGVGKEKVSCKTEIQHHEGTVVGKSPVDLRPLIGKKVSLAGEFVYGNKQCIVNKCIDIGPYAVLDISSIQVKKNKINQ